ncbi:hypothetical protein SGPA1_10139 [Streptomyces misionensis JCM 4497]
MGRGPLPRAGRRPARRPRAAQPGRPLPPAAGRRRRPARRHRAVLAVRRPPARGRRHAGRHAGPADRRHRRTRLRGPSLAVHGRGRGVVAGRRHRPPPGRTGPAQRPGPGRRPRGGVQPAPVHAERAPLHGGGRRHGRRAPGRGGRARGTPAPPAPHPDVRAPRRAGEPGDPDDRPVRGARPQRGPPGLPARAGTLDRSPRHPGLAAPRRVHRAARFRHHRPAARPRGVRRGAGAAARRHREVLLRRGGVLRPAVRRAGRCRPVRGPALHRTGRHHRHLDARTAPAHPGAGARGGVRGRIPSGQGPRTGRRRLLRLPPRRRPRPGDRRRPRRRRGQGPGRGRADRQDPQHPACAAAARRRPPAGPDPAQRRPADLAPRPVRHAGARLGEPPGRARAGPADQRRAPAAADRPRQRRGGTGPHPRHAGRRAAGGERAHGRDDAGAGGDLPAVHRRDHRGPRRSAR